MAETPFISILLLAAGAGTRMRGKDKLLETIDAIPLLRRIGSVCCASQARQVLAVLPSPTCERAAALAGLPLQILAHPGWQSGMAGTLQVGLAQVDPRAEAVMIVLADMPDITTSMIDTLIAAFALSGPHDILRAGTETGAPGHPVVLARQYFAELADLKGDTGARAVLARHKSRILCLPMPGHRAVTDLDTPEDWQQYRQTTDPA